MICIILVAGHGTILENEIKVGASSACSSPKASDWVCRTLSDIFFPCSWKKMSDKVRQTQSEAFGLSMFRLQPCPGLGLALCSLALEGLRALFKFQPVPWPGVWVWEWEWDWDWVRVRLKDWGLSWAEDIFWKEFLLYPPLKKNADYKKKTVFLCLYFMLSYYIMCFLDLQFTYSLEEFPAYKDIG